MVVWKLLNIVHVIFGMLSAGARNSTVDLLNQYNFLSELYTSEIIRYRESQGLPVVRKVMLLNIVLFARSHLLIMLLHKTTVVSCSILQPKEHSNTLHSNWPLAKTASASVGHRSEDSRRRGEQNRQWRAAVVLTLGPFIFLPPSAEWDTWDRFNAVWRIPIKLSAATGPINPATSRGVSDIFFPSKTCRNIISPIPPGLLYHSLFCALLLGPYCSVGWWEDPLSLSVVPSPIGYDKKVKNCLQEPVDDNHFTPDS